MINIQLLGPTASVSLTLNERAVCINEPSAWVFWIENQQTGQTTVFTSPDLAVQNGSRFNQFQWRSVDSSEEDLLNGLVHFTQSGTWNYVAYQFAQSSLPDLDLSNAVAEVERGLLTVSQPVSLPTFTQFQSTIQAFNS